MFIRQLSVFIENQEGRLQEVLDVLKAVNVSIISLSLADTSEYGLLRMITDKPEEGRRELKEKGFSAMLTDVLAVRLEDQVGELHSLTLILCAKGLNIEYMYSLVSGERKAIIVKASDTEAAAAAVLEGGLKLYGNEELCG